MTAAAALGLGAERGCVLGSQALCELRFLPTLTCGAPQGRASELTVLAGSQLAARVTVTVLWRIMKGEW